MDVGQQFPSRILEPIPLIHHGLVDPALQALFSQQLKEVGFSLLVPSTELQAIGLFVP